MQKIPTVFQRQEGNPALVSNRINEVAMWVIHQEGTATRKYDGTACLVSDGRLFKRYDAKKGKDPPAGFIPCQDAPDPITGHWPGWVRVREDEPADKWHSAAWQGQGADMEDGTYELCGPHVQGNPEHLDRDIFIRHGADILSPEAQRMRYLDEFAYYFRDIAPDIEGIVWHHPDGRMAKLTQRHLGLTRRRVEEGQL